MLGSVIDAEDVGQEGLLRLHRAHACGERIESPRAYPSTVISWLALDPVPLGGCPAGDPPRRQADQRSDPRHRGAPDPGRERGRQSGQGGTLGSVAELARAQQDSSSPVRAEVSPVHPRAPASHQHRAPARTILSISLRGMSGRAGAAASGRVGRRGQRSPAPAGRVGAGRARTVLILAAVGASEADGCDSESACPSRR